jgi:hypothetical protein
MGLGRTEIFYRKVLWAEMGKSGILGSSEITQNSLELKSVKSYLYFYGRPPLH